MNHLFKFTHLVAGASLMCLSVAACSASPEPRPVVAAKTGATAADKAPTARKTTWVTGQVRTAKTRMGVNLRYAMTEPSAGNVGVLNLKLTRLGQGEPVSMELRPDPEIRMESGFPAGPVAFNAGDDYSINIRPETEGMHYIHVYLQSGQRAEALAIPVQVGKTATVMAKPGTLSTMPDGQRVMSMPAQQ